MKFNKIDSKICGATAIVLATLLEAAPSKAVLYIDFIPLSPTQTRIQASGTINPSLLGSSSTPLAITTSPSGATTSLINRTSDTLRFTYSSTNQSVASRVFPIVGPNLFTSTGTNLQWTGTTPTNTSPFIFSRGATTGILFANSFTGCTPANCNAAINSNLALNGFFDVNLSLAAIGLSGPLITFTSGTEQIIFRDLTPTPGPVPLLGAAAAFGYSRKLRNRIQKSAPSRTA